MVLKTETKIEKAAKIEEREIEAITSSFTSEIPTRESCSYR